MADNVVSADPMRAKVSLFQRMGSVAPSALKLAKKAFFTPGRVGAYVGKEFMRGYEGASPAPSMLPQQAAPVAPPTPAALPSSQGAGEMLGGVVKPTVVQNPEQTPVAELPRGELAPSLLANQPTGSVGGIGGANTPANYQNVPATPSQISLLKGGKRFLGDVADIQQYAGPDQQVKGTIVPNRYGGETSSVAYVSNKTPQAPVAPPLEGQARADLLNKVGGGGVLSTNQNEINLLDRMRREGARGSASTRDQAAQAPRLMAQQQAEQYDSIGKRMSADQVANQQSLIQSQGQAAAMPAEAQARGAVGAAAEQAKAAQASLQAQRETIAAEKQTGREFTAEQKRLDRESTAKLQADRISSATERQNTEDLSRELRDTAKSIAGGDETALVSLVSMYKSIGQNPNPAVANVWHAEVQRALLPKVYELAKPGASNADKTAIYQAILKANGDLTAIYSDPAIAKLIVSAKK